MINRPIPPVQEMSNMSIFMALMRLELVNKHAENSVPEAADWVLRNLRILDHLTLLGSSSQ